MRKPRGERTMRQRSALRKHNIKKTKGASAKHTETERRRNNKQSERRMETKETNGERTLRKRSRLQSHDKKNQAAFGNTIPKPSGEETISKASGEEAIIQPSSEKTMRKQTCFKKIIRKASSLPEVNTEIKRRRDNKSSEARRNSKESDRGNNKTAVRQ